MAVILSGSFVTIESGIQPFNSPSKVLLFRKYCKFHEVTLKAPRKYQHHIGWPHRVFNIMTSSNGNIFHVTGHRWRLNSPRKDQWHEALMFSLICAWINCGVKNSQAGDFRRHRAHYDVTARNNLLLHNWSVVFILMNNRSNQFLSSIIRPLAYIL